MKLLRFLTVLACSCLAPLAFAQQKSDKPAQKSPADLAADEFFKVFGDDQAKVDQARLQKIMKSGEAFIEANPTHKRTPEVIKAVTTYPAYIKDKKTQAALGPWYTATLKYDLVNLRQKEGLSEDARAAVAALGAAAADFDARLSVSRDNVGALREKIDTLAQTPGGERYLAAAERGYYDILINGVSSRAAEAHLNKLLESPEKTVASMAREELNLLEIRKAPYELKFTAIDGKPVDVSTFRGKAVAFVFFATTNDGSKKNLDAVRDVHALYKKNLEVVAVSFDKEADREKVVAFAKDAKLGWPVHFDGLDAKNEWSAKLNVKRVPAIVLFDDKGILVNPNLQAKQLEAEVKRIGKIK